MQNPYTPRIIERIEKQTAKGVRKYGSHMQDNPLNLSISEVIEYALEECADLMVYLENVKERLGTRLFCQEFGNCDGMNGSCHHCMEENEKMFDYCREYRQNKIWLKMGGLRKEKGSANI